MKQTKITITFDDVIYMEQLRYLISAIHAQCDEDENGQSYGEYTLRVDITADDEV